MFNLSKWPLFSKRVSVIINEASAINEEYTVIEREFDKDYYVLSYPDVKESGVDPCMHFIRHGWKEMRDPAPWFNTHEYLRRNHDVREKGLNPFYHYLKYGQAEKRAAPVPALRRGEAPPEPPVDLAALADAAGFDIDAYVRSTGSVCFATFDEAMTHAIAHGYVPLDALRGEPDAQASLFLQLGITCRTRQLHDQAQSFFLAALKQNPNQFHAAQQLGDCLLDLRNFSTAAHFYRQALSINDRYFWTHANLAKTLVELHRHEEACRHAERAAEIQPGMVYAQRLVRDLRHFLGHRLIGHGFAAARAREPARCHELMNEAVARGPARPKKSGPPRLWDESEPLRVVILADDALPQCLHYRVTNKVYQLKTQNVSVQWFPKGSPQQFEDALAFANVAIFYRVPATPEIVDAIRYARSLGVPTYYDIDDLIFSSEHYPESFESYANLVTWEEYCGLTGGTELFRLAMRECDFGIASTAPLAVHMRAEVRSGEVIIVPNSIGPLHVPHMSKSAVVREPRDTVEVFYGSGTLAHKKDFEIFSAEVLAPLLEKHEHVRLTLMGNFSSLFALEPFAKRVTLLAPNWNFNDYLERLEKADINIATVSPSEFNDCKSEIKWLEAGLLGIPSVVSRTRTYRLTVEDGKTGFLCGNNREWLAALSLLVSDPDLRERVGHAAQEVIKTQYAAETVGAQFSRELTARTHKVPAKRRLRIAIAHVFYPPQAIGGATRVVQENIDALRARYGNEIEVQIFTTVEGGERAGSVQQYVINGMTVTAITVEMAVGMEWIARDEGIGQLFARYLDFTKPDIVHFHCVQRLTGSIVEVTRDAGIPYLVTVHDGWWLCDHQFLIDDTGKVWTGEALTIEGMMSANVPAVSIERTVYLRKLLADAEAVLAVSESFAEIYRDAGLTNVKAVENGTILLDPVERDATAGTKVRLGFIGGLGIHKGFDLLRDVWSERKFDNLELVLVDHAQPEMSSRPATWNGNPVSVIGRVSQDRIRDLYASLDVLLAISLWPESYGLVTREAAQAGLWVIASDRGAIGDIVVNDRNGFRIDVSDGSELEQVLIAIDQAPERYRVRTNYPLQLRTFDDQVDELVDIYRSIGPRSPDKMDGKAKIAPALLSDLPASVRPAAAGATTLGAS